MHIVYNKKYIANYISKEEEYMKKIINKGLKQAKGITLIALVITIIVLLILARSNNCNTNR